MPGKDARMLPDYWDMQADLSSHWAEIFEDIFSLIKPLFQGIVSVSYGKQ